MGSTISSISAAITAPPPSTEPPGPGPSRPGPRSPAWPLWHSGQCALPVPHASSRPEPIKLTVPRALRHRDRGVHHRPRMHASRALAEHGRDLVRLPLAPTGRGQHQHAADSEAVRLSLELGDRSGSEDHPDRKSLIDERLHGASLGAEPVSDLSHKRALAAASSIFTRARNAALT